MYGKLNHEDETLILFKYIFISRHKLDYIFNLNKKVYIHTFVCMTSFKLILRNKTLYSKYIQLLNIILNLYSLFLEDFNFKY